MCIFKHDYRSSSGLGYFRVWFRVESVTSVSYSYMGFDKAWEMQETNSPGKLNSMDLLFTWFCCFAESRSERSPRSANDFPSIPPSQLPSDFTALPKSARTFPNSAIHNRYHVVKNVLISEVIKGPKSTRYHLHQE